MNGPRKKAPMAPQLIPRISTITSISTQASITASKMKAALIQRINLTSERSLMSLFTKPAQKSFENEELDIKTKEARVDMEAERISSKMMPERDSGIMLVRSSGISLSKSGLPSINAFGVFSGLRKTCVVAPT